MQARIAWFERDQPLRNFKTGVSIHSHTNRSRESLEFVGNLLNSHPLLRTFLRSQREAANHTGLHLNLAKSYWTPPLCPRGAYELEKSQIEQHLDMRALVSLSDHDSIEAPMLLRVLPAMLDAPVSLEWTVPFQTSKFHLGVHNLPGDRAQVWMDDLHACTAQPTTARVCDLLRSLHSVPGVLIVFNHPLWNLYANPAAEFAQNLEDFLALNNSCLHAFELNGLRRLDENRRVAQFASKWQQIVVSGGDRHGCEPNGILNLTNAPSFSEWVEEVRVDRRSQLLFMPQYGDSMVARYYQTFLDAIRDYPDHSEGARYWDQRTYHPGRDGSMQPLSSLWARVPGFLRTILDFARLAETTQLLNKLRTRFGQPMTTMSDVFGQEEGVR